MSCWNGFDVVLKVVVMIFCGILKTCRLLYTFAKF